MSGIELGPRYQPLRELGSGGMGRVFLVRDSVLGREVALKLLQVAPEEEEVRRFQREFALLAGIQHPGVARVHDFGYLRVPSSPAGQGETKPRPYFTSDYVPGHPLGADGAGPEVDAIWEVAAHLAEALAFLHRHQILHLDIKPGNIILPAGRRPLRPVLIDFGLFRRGLAPLPGEALRGSVPYLAPEYFQGGDLGPWTDVYALGVTLYHWATGAFPRPGPRLEGSGWVFDAGRDLVPPPLSRLRPDFPGALESILARCLALEPEARFPSGKELLEVLGRAGAHPGSVPVSSPASTVGRDEEIRAVERFLQGFRQPGLPFALLLTGPPGMGQSHLFREMKVRAQTAGLRFHLETG